MNNEHTMLELVPSFEEYQKAKKVVIAYENEQNRLEKIRLIEFRNELSIFFKNNTQSSIWLSRESFIGLLSTAMLYFNVKGEDMQKLLEESIENNEIDYTFSNNLTSDK